jgi:hypothetical protein
MAAAFISTELLNGADTDLDARISRAVFSFLAIYLTPPGPSGCGFTSFANGTGSI